MPPESVDPSRHTFRSPRLESVVEEAIEFFNNTPIHLFPPIVGFAGVGVYALYYSGTFQPYSRIAARNLSQCELPIYVGKAVPPGWRAAHAAQTEDNRALYGRLREHMRSIEQGQNLEVEDFRCRFMILQGIESDLIAVVEAHLIRQHRPLWNTAVDGFGNHDPGRGRYNQARSEWDVLHPGRPWADRLTGTPPTLENILAKIEQITGS